MVFLFFWLFPAGDYPRSVFGGRGDFVSRLGAGGGGGDRLSDTRKGERGLGKAQAAASVGPTGLSLDFARRRESWAIDPAARKRGVCERHPALHMLSCTDLPRP